MPSGLAPAELGLQVARDPLRLPAGLIVPEPAEGQQVLRALSETASAPDWWSGRVTRREVHVVVSPGAIGLNRQMLRLMQGAESVGARGLVVVAPHVSDEALATLLVNDMRRVFARGILPLQVLVQEFHVEEMLERIALELGVAMWDGRPSVPLVRVAEVSATPDATDIWRRRRGMLDRMFERIQRR
ncbi:MAG: hypothetical protein JO023_00295 [Chloroflexi bacterium]|nr:hypothetical protein [Chloroflexota bacterium]